jgi:DNA-directed RNA polymerase specialized sigma24 family protein
MSKEIYFDSTMRGWMRNAAASALRKYPWLETRYEIDDLVQEGYLCFCKCWDTYQHLFDVEQPSEKQRRHFMSLVQVSFLNRVSNMNTRRKHENAVFFTSDWESWLGAAEEVTTLLMLLRQAPAEIKDVIDKLTSDFEFPPYQKHKLRKGSIKGFCLRETTREYWQRVLGEPDVENKLHSYFSM